MRTSDSIEDIPPVPAIHDKTCLPQDHQVLGNAALPKPEHCLHVADTLFAIPEDAQDGQPRGMTQDPEKIRLHPVDA
jgi:hypothetical protein